MAKKEKIVLSEIQLQQQQVEKKLNRLLKSKEDTEKKIEECNQQLADIAIQIQLQEKTRNEINSVVNKIDVERTKQLQDYAQLLLEEYEKEQKSEQEKIKKEVQDEKRKTKTETQNGSDKLEDEKNVSEEISEIETPDSFSENFSDGEISETQVKEKISSSF